MANKLRGWQDPSEHLPASNQQVIIFIEDLYDSKKYQVHGIHFAKPVENDGTYDIVEDKNPYSTFEDIDEYEAGWYILDPFGSIIQHVDDANVFVHRWQYMPDNPKLI